jgi:hypothetical protein
MQVSGELPQNYRPTAIEHGLADAIRRMDFSFVSALPSAGHLPGGGEIRL